MNLSAIETIIFVFSFLLLLFYLFGQKKKFDRLPPGPNGLPIIGDLYLLSAKPFVSFAQLSKKWGNIFTFNFGGFKAVILNDAKTMKEFYVQSDSANGRPLGKAWSYKTEGGGNQGVIFANGSTWSSQRRFTIRVLKEFGFGRKSIEDIITLEVEDLIEKFRKKLNSPMDIKGTFNGPVINSVWTLVTGDRNEPDCPKMTKFYENITADAVIAGVLFFFPWMLHLDTLLGWIIPNPVTAYIKRNQETLAQMRKIVEDHKNTYDENEMRDFIDVYLREIYKTNDPNSSFYKFEGEKNLITILYDLFQAGVETTSTSLIWTLLLFALNQNEQKKLYEEIRKIAGISGSVRLEHRKNMPYTEASIIEVLRIGSIIPIAFRAAVEDITYQNYLIPKGTIIMGNIHNANNCPEIWTNPEQFKPERFLSPDGSTTQKHESFTTFSMGKRNCLGEQMAMDQLFLFIGNIFQRFQVIPDPSRALPKEIKSISWGANTPITFPIIFKLRNH